MTGNEETQKQSGVAMPARPRRPMTATFAEHPVDPDTEVDHQSGHQQRLDDPLLVDLPDGPLKAIVEGGAKRREVGVNEVNR